MSDLKQRIANLSPEKRAMFERYLEDRDLKAAKNKEIPRRESSDYAPVSFAQQRLWLLDQLEPDSAIYNISAAFQISGRLDIAALEKSLNEVIHRHEALRTSFLTVDGEPVQIISPTQPIPILVNDLQELPEPLRKKELHWLANQEAQRPFNIAKDPLIRTVLLRLEENKHVLLLTIHHIVSDGWSIGVLFRELSTLYNSLCRSKPSLLPELPIQYADFAIWQRQWLQNEVLEAQLVYWKNQLSGDLPVIELPTDRPRPAALTHRGARHYFTLESDFTKALKSLCRKEGVTFFMLLLAIFKILLYRYTGQKDIIVGSPIANRNRKELEGLIGFFVNTLVLRTDFSGCPVFRELLSRVREVCFGAYEHQDLPFERLVEELNPHRDRTYTPLFQVMFSFQNTPGHRLELNNAAVTRFELENNLAKFDLTLECSMRNELLKGYFEYNTDLFDQDTIARMSGHYQTLLTGIIADPDRPVRQLPLLTDAEQNQLLDPWVDTKSTYPTDKCIHELFEDQVEKTPDGLAVLFRDQKLTYLELNKQVNMLAHYLLNRGASQGTRVGVCLERSMESILCILAILKIGGVYVPIDPEYPPERLHYLFKDSSMSILLVKESFISLPQDLDIITVRIEGAHFQINGEVEKNKINPEFYVDPKQDAYIIYTSGSTGLPKGVIVSQHALAGHSLQMVSYYNLGNTDRVLLFASLTFDASLEQIFPALLAGATLVLSGVELWDPSELHKKICSYGLTVVDLPPVYLHEWIKECTGNPEKMRADKLRLIISGGDELLPDTIKSWKQSSLRHVKLLNAYGPTESTITATAFDVTAEYRDQAHDSIPQRIPIGRPLPYRKVYVLDRFKNILPIGVPGELYIGGAGLAKGYLNRSNLTAEKFIPDPFSSEANARLYKTGDLGRYLPDGNIEYLGRVDHQVKIRGLRIELGEIETTLSTHPGIQNCAVVTSDDQAGSKQLIAYFVPNPNHQPPTSELHSFLSSKLPHYMVPAHYFQLEALPLNPNGKINRNALPDSDELLLSRRSYVAPRTKNEILLTEIWTDTLNIQLVSVYDNFFELGGHSILATRIISKIRTKFNLEVPLRVVFDHPTIAEQAKFIEGELINDQVPESLNQFVNDREDYTF